MAHFGMELNAVQASRGVLERRHRRGSGGGSASEPLGGPHHRVVVAHPHVLTLGGTREEHRAGRLHLHLGGAELGHSGASNLSAESLGHGLLPVADPQDGHP
jgi:hypothetical protein